MRAVYVLFAEVPQASDRYKCPSSAQAGTGARCSRECMQTRNAFDSTEQLPGQAARKPPRLRERPWIRTESAQVISHELLPHANHPALSSYFCEQFEKNPGYFRRVEQPASASSPCATNPATLNKPLCHDLPPQERWISAYHRVAFTALAFLVRPFFITNTYLHTLALFMSPGRDCLPGCSHFCSSCTAKGSARQRRVKESGPNRVAPRVTDSAYWFFICRFSSRL